MGRRGWVVVAVLFLRCASARLIDPTPEHPVTACIVETLEQRTRGLVPLRVQIIGTYEHDESEWMAVYPDSPRWVPIAKSSVTFVGCESQ